MNLSEAIAQLPEPPNDSHPPLWDYWRHDLWQRAQNDKPENFMQWPCVYHTMLQNHWKNSILYELEQLPIDWLQAAIATPYCQDKHYNYSLNLIHQVYHLYQYFSYTGIEVSDLNSIVEFGGGYGAMALVCKRLGFKGNYYIYDLPEFSLLQQWFLQDDTKWVDRPRKADLLIACYSLSEIDIEDREQWITPTDHQLFLYSNKFESYDNMEFFKDRGQHHKLEHLPPESWYTFK